MSSCDICGRELNGQGDTVRLYAGQLVDREVDKRKATSAIKNVRPVEVQVCRRHRFDLVKQRAMPMLIAYILLFFPVLFLVGLLDAVFPIDITTQIVLAFALNAVLVFLISRLITYDGLVAYQLNLRSRKDGIEYIPERKYRSLVRQGGR